MIKTYYATSGTGTPLTGKSFVLKDRAGALPDVPMTELGAGHYTADLPAGTAWNIYDGANPTSVAMDVLLAQTKEPIISAGNPSHAFFGNKQFRGIIKEDVSGLVTDINFLESTDVQLLQRIIALEAQVGTPSAPAPRTFEFNGKTYSLDPFTVMHQPGVIDDSASKHYYLLFGASGGVPYTINVPGDGSWVDAFRIAFDGEINYFDLNENFTPKGLLHHLNTVFMFGGANKPYLPYIDFRYSVLESPVAISDGPSPYVQVGSSVIAKQIASTNTGSGGSDEYIQHSVRDIGAQLSACGGFLKLKIEVRLKSPGAPISMTFTEYSTAHVSAQLYPEVP